MAKRFEASIEHTEHSIEKLFQTNYRTYEKIKMLTRAAIGAIIVILGLTVEMNMAFKGILMLVGCWLLISLDFPAVTKADKSVQARKGRLPVMDYIFDEQSVAVSGEGKMNIRYERFQRLVQDEGYLYLFLGKDSVCMIDRETVIPSAEELMDFMTEKTGLKWTRERGLLSMNMWDLMDAVKDRRRR